MRKAWFWILGAVVLLAIAGVLWWRAAPVAVSVVTPTRGPAIDAIYATGTVEPTVMLPIAPRVAGRIVELKVGRRQHGAQGPGARAPRRHRSRRAPSRSWRRAPATRNRSTSASTISCARVSWPWLKLDRTRADLEAAQGAVKRARSQRDYMALTAPADGLIIKRDGENGQFIPAGQAVFFLSCCAPLRVTRRSRRRGHRARGRRAEGGAARRRAAQAKSSTERSPRSRRRVIRSRAAIACASSSPTPERFKVGMTVDANLIVAERAERAPASRHRRAGDSRYGW